MICCPTTASAVTGPANSQKYSSDASGLVVTNHKARPVSDCYGPLTRRIFQLLHSKKKSQIWSHGMDTKAT